jgi:4-hydroxy-2-oxoglutarate aldolase
VQAGEIDYGKTLQEKLTPLARAVTRTYGVGGLKAALDLSGYTGGAVRRPLQAPGEDALAEIKQLLHGALVSVPGAVATGS